jgi:hypothetical protein
MEDEPTRPYWSWRLGPLILSVALYLLCLPFDTFCVSGQCSRWPGWGVLLFGPLGLLVSVTNWTWLANPFLFGAWLGLAIGGKLPSVTSGVAALALSLTALVIAVSFLFQRQIMTNEGGILFPITGYRIGYWIWLSSIAVCCFGCMATLEFSVGQKREE